MEQLKLSTPRLFSTTIISVKKDDYEEKYMHGYHTLQNLISGLSEKEAHDALNSAMSKDKSHEEIISLGLVCVMLIEPHNAAKSYRDLMLVTRDGLSMVLTQLSQLVLERWMKFQDIARSQLMWLLRELIRNGVGGVDTLCWNLMRHTAGGDISTKNIILIDSLLDIYIENRPWLDKYPVLLASVVYTYLRLIEDHNSPGLAGLRQKEVGFTVSLLRERFSECLVIGRDLVRLLQNVARIPEFEQLWRDILRNPKSLNTSFMGVLQMLQTRTSRRFLQSRLTPDMEQKLVFLTSAVRFGNHKRYQDWFQKQYLATPEAQTLRSDLIRFIVGVIHPTNELLCSDIIPRWAVIGWLLTTTTSNIAVSNAKLALFYDWLFFDPDKDNIMNIEPAILVMHHSMRSHPAVTASLLDFLCRIIPNFYPLLSDKVRLGIFTSLRQILEKRVLPTLYPLFDNPRLDRELRLLVRETFLEFCCPPTIEGNKIDDIKEDLNHIEEHPNHSMPNNHVDQSEPVFSDEEGDLVIRQGADEEDDDDIPLEYPYQSLNKLFQMSLQCMLQKFAAPYYEFSYAFNSFQIAKVRLKGTPPPEELKIENTDIAHGLEGPLRTAIERLHAENDNEKKCQAMERLVQLVIQEEDLDSDIVATLGSCLCTVLQKELTESVFPNTVTEETIEDSIGLPLFVLFRNLSELTEEDTRRLPLLSVLSEMYNQQQRIGYLLLYYLQASLPPDDGEGSKMNSNGKSHVYKEFCVTMDKELEPCLLTDLKLCQEDDIQLLCWLVPGIYSQFPNVAVGNAALLHLVVSTVDARQLQELVCRVVQGRLVMFRGDSFLALLSASLSWETFEQYCLWQLVTAHGIPVDYVLPILPRLEYSNHAEALTSILLMLKQEKPTAELVKHVLSRDVKPDGDMFVVSALRSWCREHEERLGELVASLLSSKCPPTSPNKRKRGSALKTSGPGAAEKLLGHLDRLRPGCRQFYKLEAMQKALQQAQSSCTDLQRNLFSNLFALIEVDDSGRGKGRGRKPNSSTSNVKSKPNRVVKGGVSDSTDESSEEEEIVKPKQAKKRKKVNPVGSDSD